MFGSDSLVDKLKSFDVYRKLPKSYLQPTFIGAFCKYKYNIIKIYSVCHFYYFNGFSFFK